MRINKYIAHAGVASRRKAEELIKQGLVTVNGQVVRELATTIKTGDKVEVEGQPIYNEEKVYYLLNKPRGVISSVTDDKGRKTVVDLLPNVKERIYPVGRLDWDTSGVLILTNDGDFTDEMIHPRNEIDKVYVARVKGVANKDNLRPLTRGLEIDAIRGVNSSGALAKLQAFELIREDGKKEVLGRPNLYVTTDYFLDYMGINHLEELPVIDELEIQAQESQLFGERIEEDENQ